MNEKGLTVLNTIVENFGSDIISEVVSCKDKKVLNDFYDDIIKACDDNGIRFYDKKDYKDHVAYAIAVGWRWMIKSENLIVIHDSLLPSYRGFSPLVSMLINKEERIGVTALFAEDTYDTGPIIEKFCTKIRYPIKIQDAIKAILPLYRTAATHIIENILNGTLTGEKQNNILASYSLWRDEEDYFIDWNKSADYIRRFVDAVGFPYKGAKSHMNEKTVRILDVEEVDDVKIEGDRAVGKVIFMRDGKPVVVCGNGLIKINKMAHEDGRRAEIKSFRTRF